MIRNRTFACAAAVFALVGWGAGCRAAEPPESVPQSTPAPPAPVAAESTGSAAEWMPLNSQIVDTRVLVEARVGDATGWFELDSGAPVSCFDSAWARAHDLEIVRDAPAGNELVGRARVVRATIEIGTALVKVKDAVCYDFRKEDVAGPEIAGLLGGDFLADHIVRIRYGEGHVDVGTTARPAMALGSLSVPIYIDHYAYTTIVLHSDSGPAIGALVMIDTGNSGPLQISGSIAKRMGLKIQEGPGIEQHWQFGVRHAHPAGVISLAFGTSELGGLSVLADDQQQRDLLLGSELLSQFTVVLDYPHNLLVLSPRATRNDAGKPHLGFSIVPPAEDGVLRIADVLEGERAQQAGLKDGDVLLMVNGRDLVKSGVLDVMVMVDKAMEEGKVLIFRVRRGVQMLDANIDLQMAPEGATK